MLCPTGVFHHLLPLRGPGPLDELHGGEWQSFILLSLASYPPPLCSFLALSFSALLSASLSPSSPTSLSLSVLFFFSLSLTHTPPLSLWGQLLGFPLKRQEKFVTNVFSSKKIH